MKTFSHNGASLWHRLPPEKTEVGHFGTAQLKGSLRVVLDWCANHGVGKDFYFFSSTVQNWISGSKYARTRYNPVLKSVPSCPGEGLLGLPRGTSKVCLCPVHFILIARIVSWVFRRSRVGWSHNLNIKVQHFIFNITLLLLGSPFHFKVDIIISLNVSWFDITVRWSQRCWVARVRKPESSFIYRQCDL